MSYIVSYSSLGLIMKEQINETEAMNIINLKYINEKQLSYKGR